MQKWLALCFIYLSLFILSACGASGGTATSSSNSNNNAVSLNFVTPAAYPIQPDTVSAYYSISNNSNTAITNLVFSIESNTTEVAIRVANGEDNPCTTIAAYSSCAFPVTIAPSPQAGSFQLNVSSPTIASLSLSQKIKSGTKQAGASDFSTLTGVMDIDPTVATGANGITFLNSSIVTANESGATQIIVVAVVNSPNASSAGSFNTINLTDATGNLLVFSPLSGNSGNVESSLDQNAIVSFILTIPQGVSSYTFYAQLAQTTESNQTVISQGSTVQTITIVPNGSQRGILVVHPSSFDLTTSDESQVLTYSNSGNATISALDIVTASPLTAGTTTCGTSLAPNTSCTYTVGFDSNQYITGTSNVTATYNDGQNPGQTTVATVDYNGVNPTALLTTPRAGAESVAIDTPIIVTFSTAIIPSTVNSNTFKVGTRAHGSQVAGVISVSADNESATFTPSAPLATNKTYYVTLTSEIQASSGDQNSLTPYFAAFTTRPAYSIFIAQNGGVGWDAALGGVTGADAKCQADPQCQDGWTCKAMLVDGVNRAAAPTPLNWVLAPYTEYQNVAGKIIGTTGINRIVTTESAVNSQVFSFPLQHTLATNTTLNDPSIIWTGMNGDWTSTDISYNCNNWTLTSDNVDGISGDIFTRSKDLLSYSIYPCSRGFALACVEQVPNAPTALMTSPQPGESVATSQTITVTFSQAIVESTVNSSTFHVGISIGGNEVSGSISVAQNRLSATFTPNAALSNGTVFYVTLSSAITSTAGVALSSYATNFNTGQPYLIFVANNNAVGWAGGQVGGVSGADAKCQADSQCQNGWTCKAMLVDESGTRTAAPAPVNWVLHPNTQYKNSSGNIIGVTGANPTGYTESAPNSQTFAFPLFNPFQEDYTISLIATGLNSDWTTSDATCNSWTDNNSWQQVGSLGDTGAISINYSSYECTLLIAIACVQQ